MEFAAGGDLGRGVNTLLGPQFTAEISKCNILKARWCFSDVQQPSAARKLWPQAVSHSHTRAGEIPLRRIESLAGANPARVDYYSGNIALLGAWVYTPV